ncbi:hypothetical protein, partial [Escherichia coli]|uniref:hypothetical protein n=1 Tax=Escherichia coli TaxID=562 RepID=UPI003D082B20
QERIAAIRELGGDNDDILRYDLAAAIKEAKGLSRHSLLAPTYAQAQTDGYLALKLAQALFPDEFGTVKQRIVVSQANPL